MRSLLITGLALFLSVAHSSRADGQSTLVDKTRASSTLQVDPLPPDAFSILAPDNIRTGEAPDGQRVRHLDVSVVTFSPNGKLLAACYFGDSSVCLWDLASKRVRFTLDQVAQGTMRRSLAFSMDGKRLLVGRVSEISSYSADTGKHIENYPINEDGKDLYRSPIIQVGNEGKTLAAICGTTGGVNEPFGAGRFAVLSWDIRAGRRVSASPLPEDMMSNYGRFSADGRLVALPSGIVVEVATGKELVRVLKSGMGMTSAVALSSDGAYVALGINEKDDGINKANAHEMAVGVYEVLTGLQVVRLETGDVAHVAFMPGSREVVTAGLDSIQRWDLASGNLIASLGAPRRQRGVFGPSFASSMAVAADGQTVATGLPDKSVLLWRLPAPVRVLAKTSLKPEELNRCWADLARRDAHWAFVAREKLLEAPEQTVTLFRERLKAVALPSVSELRRLVDDLDHEDSNHCEAASERILEYGRIVEPLLREVLRDELPSEKRRRATALLAVFSSFCPADARRVRAVQTLELIDSLEARKLLEDLASGKPETIHSKQARLALERRRSAK